MKKNKKTKKIPLILLTIIILTIISFININKKLSPRLIEYAELELKKISNLIITKSISTKNLDTTEMFLITRNDKNEILTIDINTKILNKLIIESTINIQENLKKLEQGEINNYAENKGGVVLYIPTGSIYNNFLLNNLGPKIPVKLKILGDIESKTNAKVTNYGINNSLIELTLDITVNEKVILPITTKTIKVTTTIPIVIKLIQGTVPNYYSGEINKSQTFSIPLE